MYAPILTSSEMGAFLAGSGVTPFFRDPRLAHQRSVRSRDVIGPGAP